MESSAMSAVTFAESSFAALRRALVSSAAAASRAVSAASMSPERFFALFPALTPADLVAAPLGVSEHLFDRAAVLSLQPVEHVKPFFDSEQPLRVGIDGAAVFADPGAEVGHLG